MGVGGAGRQAAGLDASTASGNPAGMTRLDRTQVQGGFMGLYVEAKFDVKDSSHGGNAGYFSPAGTMYLVHSVSPDFKIGLGVGTYFGLGVNYVSQVNFNFDFEDEMRFKNMDGTVLGAALAANGLLGADLKINYAAGVQYDWSKDLSVGLAYTLIDSGSAKVNQSGGPLKGDLAGEYGPNYVHAFNVNFVYRF